MELLELQKQQVGRSPQAFQRLSLTLRLAARAFVLLRAAVEYSPVAATQMKKKVIKSPLLVWTISFLKKRESW